MIPVYEFREGKMLKIGTAAPHADPTTDLTIQKKRLKECCQNFEAIMMSNLLKEMRQNPLSCESTDQGREIYQGMMDESVAGTLSLKGDMGMGESLYRQLAPLMESKVK